MPEKQDDLKTLHLQDKLDIIDWVDDLLVPHMTSSLRGEEGFKLHLESVTTARLVAVEIKEKFGEEAFLTPYQLK